MLPSMSHTIEMNIQLYHRLYSISVMKDDPFWQQTFDPTSVESCEHVIYYCEGEFEAQQGYDSMQTIATALIEDIIELKNQSQAPLIFEFLQFCISTLVAKFAGSNKVIGLAFNWLANSLDDVVVADLVRDPDPGRIYYFVRSTHPFIRLYIMLYLNIWCHTLYYYSRITGGHFPMASGFVKAYGNFYLAIPPDNVTTEYLRALCDILAWSVCNNQVEAIAQTASRLHWLYSHPELPAPWKKMIVFQFSCVVGTVAEQPQEYWSNLILTTYRDQLRGFEKLHALVNYTHDNGDRISAHLNDFSEAIEIYRHSLGLSERQSSFISYELSRSFEVVMPILGTLVKVGKGNEAFQLVVQFFNIQPAKDNADTIMHVIPYDIDGVVYSLAQEPAVIHEGDTRQSYIEVIQRLNTFLQHSIYLTCLPGYAPPPPPAGRNGAPVEAQAGGYLNALVAHFKFNRVNELLPLQDAKSYYLYNGFNLPVQPVMLRETGFVVPMCYSYQQPQEAREIRSVLLWQDDSYFSSFECDGIIHILTKANITTVRLNAYEHTLDDFKREYESNDYDCVHIAAHGEHRHYEPHQSYIQLSETIQLHNEQLTSFENAWDLRRLLILNICDGATTSLFNSPVSIGVSNHLIHSKQSVLSHLWPVNNRVAGVYGFLLAACIVKRLPYVEIYKEVVSKLMEGKAAVIEYLHEYADDDEMFQTIENANLDLSNFTHWGSLAYLE